MNQMAVSVAVEIMGRGGEKTHQTQHQFYSTSSAEKCYILPVPFYNNTSIIITVAKMKREKEKKNDEKQRDVKDKHGIR